MPVPNTARPDADQLHACGGTILSDSPFHRHEYCDRCGAFQYDVSCPFPDGTDAEANKEAWDNGDRCSPFAVAATA